MRRLGKAAKYGEMFEKLANEKADDRTALEAEVSCVCISFAHFRFLQKMF